ncbi:hypothetical protein BDD43_5112 [Mucilaginibacter gracilis]|uniref:Uncharacterized protein n=1 Tax=Mucilaginibacter gracilis TaxID=423350 RepID=A0A495J9X0_9SPHI|nr:hypothetical protein [Mucilaginibacter gracilis]RKR84859.1 hypothetical protein BDD43_5112 [Mucilaginibacter gracilis]
MKRLLLILLVAAYLLSGLGVSAKGTCCMGVLRLTAISHGTHCKKHTCKMAARKRCCQAQKQLLQVNDVHIYQGPLYFLTRLFPVLFNYSNDNKPAVAAIISKQQQYCSPAKLASLKNPAYILNCNYRI